jgi:hypothetical protein
MTISAANSVHSHSHGSLSQSAALNSASFGRSHSSASHAHHTTGLDRYRATPEPTQPNLTPVQQGDAARAADAAAAGAKATGAKSSATTPPHHPIRVSSTVETRADGVRVSTVYIDVRANFRVDGGTLPTGQTAEARAGVIERAIERDFSATYRNPDGSITRYVTDVRMTVGEPDSAARTQLVLVAEGDSRIGSALGMAPGFEKGNIAYIGDHAGARTAPHEFGHLAGLRHTAQMPSCTTAPGISVENLMSQTGCSPTSEQIERSQLQQIFKTPEFR